jgi:integrase
MPAHLQGCRIPGTQSGSPVLQTCRIQSRIWRTSGLFSSHCRSFDTLSSNRECSSRDVPIRMLARLIPIIRRRAKGAAIHTKIGNHTFRATGITAYLRNGGRLEVAQQIAAHESSRTTGLYDRRGDDVSLDEVELIRI